MLTMRRVLSLLVCLLFLTPLCAADAEPLQAGDTLFFGHYMQEKTGSEKQPVEWIVLAVEDGRALLLSRSVLLCRQYHSDWRLISWEKCTLRPWLNETFLDLVFSEEEQQRILPTETDTDVTDQVFLLSKEEALRYLPEAADRKASPTAFAAQRGTSTWEDGTCKWWLRTNVETSTSDAVYFDGETCYLSVDFTTTGVRPAIWISVDP